ARAGSVAAHMSNREQQKSAAEGRKGGQLFSVEREGGRVLESARRGTPSAWQCPSPAPSRQGHSGSPAFRRPSAYLARSSGRQNSTRSLRLETRKSGSSWRTRAMACCAASRLPARALLAAAARAGPGETKFSPNALAAHDTASS